ncbi:MAG: hypothetical protein DMF69_14275 [Acidobacteria bacterium]|nr:MAG: hypothetical protein DMF69_14275 [Acidobacteriota bacterium]
MRRLFATLCFLTIVVVSASAQSTEPPTRVAVLDFGETSFGKTAADKLRTALRSTSSIQLIDRDLSKAAALGVGYTGSLNLSLPEARNLGAAIETDFYIIGEAQALRRSSSQVPVFYESYASIFVISSRTGRLLNWERSSFEADTATAAEEKLISHLSNGETIQHCLKTIRRALDDERNERVVLEVNAPIIEEAPDDDSTAAEQGLRLPRPYRRLRPTYPDTAARAEAEATVDVVVDIGADGEVTKVQVARWAGFGLDDTTVATVRQMHFFPAMRNGTPIPMRVLLRYNFRKPTQ